MHSEKANRVNKHDVVTRKGRKIAVHSSKGRAKKAFLTYASNRVSVSFEGANGRDFWAVVGNAMILAGPGAD